MKSFTHTFCRTLLMLMSLLALSLSLNQFAQAAPVACSFSISGGTSIELDDPSTAFTFTVTASQANCTWTAKSNNVWMQVTSGANYTGTAKVTVMVTANPTAFTRTGTLTVAGQIFTVEQQGQCKTQSIGQAIRTIGKAGGDISIDVAHQGECTWAPKIDVVWLKLNGPAEYTTSKKLIFTVLNNDGPARTGVIRIGNYRTTILQEGTCQYTVSQTSLSVAGAGLIVDGAVADDKRIEVTAHPTCKFTATSDSAWAKIDKVSTTSDPNVQWVYYTISPNTGAARTAKFTIAGKQVTISQAAAQPAPQLLYVNPGFVAAGSPSMTVTLTGNNFTVNSQVRWNGFTRQALFVTSTQLRLTLQADDLKTAARHQVTVFDGGANQTSNEQPFLVLSPQASVSAASYKGEDIAPDSIVAAFGVKLADSTAIAKTIPLPTSLAGTMVRVIDSKNIERLAPLFFVSAGQVNYLVPPETALGKATVIIISASVNISLGYVNIAKVAPGVFTATANGAGHPSALALRIKANGAQVYEPVVAFDQASQKFVPLPIDVDVLGEQVFLVLYGTGMRNHGGLNTVSLTIGGTPVTASYLGASGLTGLDQLNARLPESLEERGEVNLVLTVDGKVANTVKLTFK